MRKNQILIHSAVCEACVFASETDIPSGLTENYMYCEASCILTMAGKCCSSFIPKRKYKGKVHVVYWW